jgi:two-component system sensor histidine kinase PilS (NtrC family)
MEDAVRRSEKFAAIGKMAAGIAHEIRNPLASISGSIQMMQRQAGAEGVNRRLQDIVLREIDRLNDLINDFLNFARPRALEIDEIPLQRLLGEVVEVFRHMRNKGDADDRPCNVRLEVEPGLTVDADPQQLRQVLWNLLNNALEATDGDGEVRVTARRVESADGPNVELEVADRGVGIPAEHLARIFDPFFTTKDRGTGLGLSLVHRIIEDHRGTLRVDTEPGRGSTFTVTLPLRSKTEP